MVSTLDSASGGLGLKTGCGSLFTVIFLTLQCLSPTMNIYGYRSTVGETNEI